MAVTSATIVIFGEAIRDPVVLVSRISYVTGGLITAVIGTVMMPWKLHSDAAAYIFTWLLGYSSLMGALGGDGCPPRTSSITCTRTRGS